MRQGGEEGRPGSASHTSIQLPSGWMERHRHEGLPASQGQSAWTLSPPLASGSVPGRFAMLPNGDGGKLLGFQSLPPLPDSLAGP